MIKVSRIIYFLTFRVLFTITCFISFIPASRAQPQAFGNEWIVSGQKYYKAGVSSNGIYRITYQELKNAGMDISTVNPKKIQVFHHGREMAVRIEGESDNEFNTNDYIEFYAEKNNGELDSLVYKYAKRPHPYQTLYSEQTSYFITAGQNDGKRTQAYASGNDPVTDTYHIEEQIVATNAQFSFNNFTSLVPLVQQSYYEEGEGWSGKYMTVDSIARFPLKMTGRVNTNNQKPKLEFQLNGRSRNSHKVWYALNEEKSIDTVIIAPYSPFKISLDLNTSQIVDEKIVLKTRLMGSSISDWYSMNYIKLSYPQAFAMSGAKSKYFNLAENKAGNSVIQIQDISQDNIIYDITDRYNQRTATLSNGKFRVENTTVKRKLFVSNEIKKTLSVEAVSFRRLDQEANYLIITHKSLLESASEYASYRSSAQGGGFKPLIVETREIYDQFNYGERNPAAIKKFSGYMLAKGQDKYMMLLGRAISFPDSLKKSEASDMVPTVGYPGSDVLLTEGIAGYPEFVQAIPTGRLNITTNEQVRNYLGKVKEFEATQPASWNKRVLHLSGGKTKSEINSLKGFLEEIKSIAENQYLGGQVTSKNKQTEEDVEPIDISAQVNEGVSMITFAGHGSPTVIDLNFGYVSDPKYNFKNKGKYPLMFFNGCGVGNIFYRYQTLSTDWLVTPDKGSIVILANSFWSYVSSTQTYLQTLYKKSFEDPSGLNASIGKIQQEMHKSLAKQAQTDQLLRMDLQQVILQGDPAIKIFKLSKPDFSAGKIFISSAKPGSPMNSGDSLNVGIIASNYGKYESGKQIPVGITVKMANGQSRPYSFRMNAMAFTDTVSFSVKREPGIKSIEVFLDHRSETEELNENNNSAALDLGNWDEISKNNSYPNNILPDKLSPLLMVTIDGKAIANNDFVSKNPAIEVTLADDNDIPVENKDNLETFIRKCESCSFEKLNHETGVQNLPGKLIIRYQLDDLVPGTYELLARGSDLAGNVTRNPYLISFRVAEASEPFQWSVFPNPGQYFVKINFKVIGQAAPESATAYFYNNQGAIVDTLSIQPTVGENTFYWEKISELPAGIYHLLLKIAVNGKQEIVKGKILKN